MNDSNNTGNGEGMRQGGFPYRGHNFHHSPRGSNGHGPRHSHSGPSPHIPLAHHHNGHGESNHNAPFPLPPPDFQRWRNSNNFGTPGGTPPFRPPCMPGGLPQPGSGYRGPSPSHNQRYQGRPRFFRGNGRGRGHGQKRNWNQANDSGQDDNKKSNKKSKAVKDPSSLAFYCKSCDRGYNQEDTYELHLSTHVKCDRDGCPYVASEKLVELHKTMQHLNGMAQKIWKLESPEDIQKWRNERKKNFPTKENVAKKEAIRKEKIERGEVLETKSFGKFGRGRRGNQRGNRGRRGGRGHQRFNKQIEMPESGNDQSQGSTNTEKQAEKNGDPLSLLLTGDKDSDSEEHTASPKSVAASSSDAAAAEENSSSSLLGGLGLLACYGDSSSEEEGEIKNEQDTTAGNTSKSTEPQQSSPGKEAHNATDDTTTNCHNAPKQKHKNHKGPKNKKNSQPHRKVPKRQLSLLEKLLAPDIRHERNAILQCVRYIVKKDFFGIRNNNNDQKMMDPKEQKSSQNTASEITFADTI